MQNSRTPLPTKKPSYDRHPASLQAPSLPGLLKLPPTINFFIILNAAHLSSTFTLLASSIIFKHFELENHALKNLRGFVSQTLSSSIKSKGQLSDMVIDKPHYLNLNFSHTIFFNQLLQKVTLTIMQNKVKFDSTFHQKKIYAYSTSFAFSIHLCEFISWMPPYRVDEHLELALYPLPLVSFSSFQLLPISPILLHFMRVTPSFKHRNYHSLKPPHFPQNSVHAISLIIQPALSSCCSSMTISLLMTSSSFLDIGPTCKTFKRRGITCCRLVGFSQVILAITPIWII